MSNIITAMVLIVPLYGVSDVSGGGYEASQIGIAQSRRSASALVSASLNDSRDISSGRQAVSSPSEWVSPPASLFPQPHRERPGAIRRVVDRIVNILNPSPPGLPGRQPGTPGAVDAPGGPACQWRGRS